MTRAMNRSTVTAALGALLLGLAVAAVPQSASGLPGGCTTTWQGGNGGNWNVAANWNHGLPTSGSVACIGAGGSAVLGSGEVHVAKLHIDGGLTVQGASLFVDSADGSEWSSGSQVTVDHGTVGGTGHIFVHGVVHFSGGSVLTSAPGGPGTVWPGQHGTLDIPGDGQVFIDDSSLSLRTRYTIGIFGELVVQSDGLVTADWGTMTTVVQGGLLELNGAGGYYQGSPVSGQSLGDLVNAGLIAKTGGGTTSIVEAAYNQTSTGTTEVDCCATLAFAGSQVVSGLVQPAMSLGTGACGAGTTSVCGGSVDPAVDPSSVKLELSGSNGNASAVQVQELGLPAVTTDSRAIGNEVFAHAAQLTNDPANPATLTLRFSQADVMSTPLSEIQVGHISDTGLMTKTPDCVGGNLPSGAVYCVVRPVTRTAQNTFVTVKTTQTSRWRLRRTGPNESFDQTPPGAPGGLAAKLAAPFDGSAVALSWAPPANDGGAAPTSYRVFRDGQSLGSVTGSSAVVASSGPGDHVFTVRAVNVIGEGPASGGATIKIAKLSKPRKVKGVQGAPGGKLTAGAKWLTPAAAGGFAITKYKVAIFKKNGTKVATKVVSATKHRYLFKLKSGRYFVKVRARNADRWGPWSKPTKLVRAR